MTDASPASAPASERLRQLAEAHGVTTRHWDFHGNPASPSRQTLVAVLAALGVAAATDEEIEASLREAETAPWRQVLPATVVARAGAQTPVVVHLPDGAPLRVQVRLEDGGVRELSQADDWTPAREVDGVMTGQATVLVPADLPLGWHELVAEIGQSWAGPARTATAALAVTPDRLELPDRKSVV